MKKKSFSSFLRKKRKILYIFLLKQWQYSHNQYAFAQQHKSYVILDFSKKYIMVLLFKVSSYSVCHITPISPTKRKNVSTQIYKPKKNHFVYFKSDRIPNQVGPNERIFEPANSIKTATNNFLVAIGETCGFFFQLNAIIDKMYTNNNPICVIQYIILLKEL